MPQLARRIGRAKPSAIMQIAEKAKRLKSEGRDIINKVKLEGDVDAALAAKADRVAEWNTTLDANARP